MESFFADSTKPQVLTTTASALSGSATTRHPLLSSRPASSSESTSLRAQPSVTSATLRGMAGSLSVGGRGSAGVTGVLRRERQVRDLAGLPGHAEVAAVDDQSDRRGVAD